MNQQAEEIFKSAQDMMDSIRAVQGAPYARTVEIALNMMKLRSLIGTMLQDMEDELGKERCSRIFDAVNTVCAQVISLSAANADLVKTADPAELLDWAHKIMELEERGVEALND